MIMLSKQTVQHIVDLLKEDWPTTVLETDPLLLNEGEKMIHFLEKKLEETK